MSVHPSAETLQLHLDGALPPAARGATEAHLRACESCTAELESMRSLMASLEALPEPGLPEDFAAELAEEVAPSRELRVPRATPAVLIGSGACAALLVASCSAILAMDSPVTGVTDDLAGNIDLLLGSPFQVQAAVLGGLALLVAAGIGLLARLLSSAPAPQLTERR